LLPVFSLMHRRIPQAVIAGCALLALSAGAARAETCKYEDPEGRVIYSNVPMKGAKKLMCFEPPEPVPPPKQKQKAQGPADFPRVDRSQQKQRDDSRRRILEEELLAEEARLADARKALEEGKQKPEVATRQVAGPDGRMTTQTFRNVPKYEAKVKALEDEVQLHERNVEALKKELGNLK
jgi:cell division protein FtsB